MATIFFGDGDDDWIPSDEDPNTDDEFHGGGGNDTLAGDYHSDVPGGADKLFGDAGDDRLTGRNGSDSVYGGAGNDKISGGFSYQDQGAFNPDPGANDFLNGGAGADTIDGGRGIDTADYGDSSAGVEVIIGGTSHGGDAEGDWVRDDVEHLIGSNFNDTLVGTAVDNFFQGLAGDDQFFGGDGGDTFYGGDGEDYFEGGAGADGFYGGGGIHDRVSYFNQAEAVFLRIGVGAASGGEADGDFLALSIEEVQGSNIGGDVIFGSDFNNGLFGEGGDDILTGEGGDDRLVGGAGNDILRGGLGGDRFEGGQGVDVADYSKANGGVYADLLGDLLNKGEAAGDKYFSIENLEGSAFNDTLVGDESANTILGNDGDDSINGRDGNDTFNGGAGLDTLQGSGGNDLYVLDDTTSVLGSLRYDTVVEFENDGIDSVLVNSDAPSSSIAPGYTLTANVENGTISGVADFRLTGNASNNALNGNEAANALSGLDGSDSLFGGFGADTLTGGSGDDVYLLADVFAPDAISATRFDSVNEAAGGGIDTVQVVSGLKLGYTLAAEVENGTVLGASAMSLTGNEINNALTGNGAANALTGLAGNDRLDGGLGGDTLKGGLGNDTYILQDTFGQSSISAGHYDTVVENADAGIDTIRISQAGTLRGYTLDANVENGVITGDQLFNLNGNGLDNALTGNDARNFLTGRGGDDALAGGLGRDVLAGGGGNDTLTGGENADRLAGNAGSDTFDFNAIADSEAAASVRDVIEGFVHLADKINLATLDASDGAAGNQAFTFMGAADFSAEGQVRATQLGDNTLIQLNISGNLRAEMSIVLSDFVATTLTAQDFVL